MGIVIDFHAHILPGADHGSFSLEESLWQLRSAKAAGVDLVIATPHFYPEEHRVDEFLAMREKLTAKLKKANGEKTLRIRPGAEVLLCEGLDRMEGLEKLCIQGTDILLLEMPFAEVTDEMFRTIERLEKGGKVRPVLAHIDRYRFETAARALSCTPRAQINVQSLTGFFGMRRLKPFLDGGFVYALGSDIHRRGNQYTAFARVLKKRSSEAEEIMRRTASLLKIK
ncbi:MAG: histidinol-phosphatase [Clostridia bacterium]|nr:histidinol-phosphatase [Clostridia bacterium]